VRDVWIGSEERDKRGSEFGVLLRKLKRQRRDDEFEITTVFETSRAEERGTQTAVGEHPFRDGLSDGGFPSPGEPVEPKDGRLLGILGPALDLVQDGSSRSLQATVSISMTIFCSPRTGTGIQNQGRDFKT